MSMTMDRRTILKAGTLGLGLLAACAVSATAALASTEGLITPSLRGPAFQGDLNEKGWPTALATLSVGVIPLEDAPKGYEEFDAPPVTTLSVPVMTRLRQPERQVLDTLVDAGVARSRSDALAWCVRLVGEHADDWLAQLREAMQAVERVRSQGPDL